MVTLPIKTIPTALFNTSTLSFQSTNNQKYGGFSSAQAQQKALQDAIAQSQQQNPEKFKKETKQQGYPVQPKQIIIKPKPIQSSISPPKQIQPKQPIQPKQIQGPVKPSSININASKGKISIANVARQSTPIQTNPLGEIAKGATNTLRDYANILNINAPSKSLINKSTEAIFEGNYNKAKKTITSNPARLAGEVLVEAPLLALPIGPAVRAIKSVATATKTILKGRQMLAHPDILSKYTPKQIESVERLVDTAKDDPKAFKKLEGMVSGLDKKIQKDIDKQLKTKVTPSELKEKIKNKRYDTFKSDIDGEKYSYTPGGFSQTKAQVAEMDRLKAIASDESLPMSTRTNAIKMIEKYTKKVYPPKTGFSDVDTLRGIGLSLGAGGLGAVGVLSQQQEAEAFPIGPLAKGVGKIAEQSNFEKAFRALPGDEQTKIFTKAFFSSETPKIATKIERTEKLQKIKQLQKKADILGLINPSEKKHTSEYWNKRAKRVFGDDLSHTKKLSLGGLVAGLGTLLPNVPEADAFPLAPVIKATNKVVEIVGSKPTLAKYLEDGVTLAPKGYKGQKYFSIEESKQMRNQYQINRYKNIRGINQGYEMRPYHRKSEGWRPRRENRFGIPSVIKVGGVGVVGTGFGVDNVYADNGLGSPNPFDILGKTASDVYNFFVPQTTSKKTQTKMSSYTPKPKSKEQYIREQKYLAPFGGDKDVALTNEMMKSQQLYPKSWEGKYRNPKTNISKSTNDITHSVYDFFTKGVVKEAYAQLPNNQFDMLNPWATLSPTPLPNNNTVVDSEFVQVYTEPTKTNVKSNEVKPKPKQRDLMAEYMNNPKNNPAKIPGTSSKYSGSPSDPKLSQALEQQRKDRELNEQHMKNTVGQTGVWKNPYGKIYDIPNFSNEAKTYVDEYSKQMVNGGLFANPYFGKPSGYGIQKGTQKSTGLIEVVLKNGKTVFVTKEDFDKMKKQGYGK